MNTQSLLEAAAKILLPWTVRSTNPEPERLDVYIDALNLKPAVKALTKAHWGYFSALTGLDQPPTGEGETAVEGHVEALYHFTSGAAIVTLRVSVPYSNARVDSICDILPSATLYERELIELLGVEVIDTPSTERLLLSDDWPEGVYPLRKSFTGLPKPEQEAKNGKPA
jgi:Ni,Fe-hydrogenase III component G